MARVVALIMAGGGGTRLWPASTAARPKQLLDPTLSGEGSLLQRTVDRVAGVVEPSDVWVVCGQGEADGVRSVLGDGAQVIAEPARRNTAPCIALACVHLRDRLGDAADDAVLVALPADHHVADPAGLRRLVRAAVAHASAANTIVTLGIAPDHPATGFGYIERRGEALPAVAGDEGVTVYPAERFVEKPDRATAEGFLAGGRHLWNAGIFVMPMRRIEAELATHCGPTWSALGAVGAALADGGDVAAATAAAYDAITPAPIDIAVMEKQTDLRVIEADVGWSDLGAWPAVHAMGQPDDAGNVVVAGSEAVAALIDASDNLVWTEDAQVGVLGVSGLAVVASKGRVLVCPLSRAQDVKTLLETLD